MSAKRASLGRGLGALIKEVPTAETPPAEAEEAASTIPVDQIRKSSWQHRRNFTPEALEDLVHSIRVRGVLQPLLVRQVDDQYELIAGERRFRAAQEAGLKEVPALVMDVTDQEALELALIENLQREDLNLIEEAEGYQSLLDKFSMTQEQIAERVGKARATVANALRVLSLPAPVKDMVADGRLSPGHAKVILGLEIPDEQTLLAARTVKEGLSVRALEKIIQKLRKPPKKPRAEKADIPADHLRYITDKLHERLGTSVRVSSCKTLANGKKVKGRVEVDFYSAEDLDRLLEILGLVEEL